MSSLFGRIGTQAMKYSFELTIQSLHMSIPLTAPMCVKWTRGPRTATNQPVAGVGGNYTWPSASSKPLTIIATMYFKKNKFQEKKSKITVKQLMGKELKSVGQVELDLADFCADNSEQARPLTLKLQKCSDKKAFLVVSVKSKWIKQLQAADADETASQMSGASSVDARSESAMPGQHAADVADLNDLDGMEEAAEDDDGGGGGGGSGSAEHSQTRSGAGAGAAAASAAASSNHGHTGSNSSSLHSLQMSPGSSNLGAAHPAASPSNNSSSSASMPVLQVTTSTPAQERALQDQAKQIESLQAKVSELTAAVNTERAAAAKSGALAAQLAQLTSQLESLQREKADHEAEADRDIVRLRTDLKNAQNELAASATERAQSAKKTEAQLQEQAAENEKLRTRLTEAEAENRTLAAAAAAASSGGAPSDSDAALAAAAAAAQARLTETFDRERAAFQKQLQDLRAQLESASSKSTELEARLTAQEARLKDASEAASKELTSRDAEVDALERSLAATAALLSTANESLRAQENAAIDARRNAKEVANELASLQTSFLAEMARREAAETHLEAEFQALQEAKTQLRKAELAHETEIKNMRNAQEAEIKKLAKEREDAATAGAAASPSPVAASAAAAPSSEDASSLQRKVDDLMLRLVASDDDRVRLSTEVDRLDSALSKQKEDELVALEERYEESYRMKKLLKEKENEIEELSKQTKEQAREAKEQKSKLDAAHKELAAKTQLIEAAQVRNESLTAKLAQATEDSKKLKSALDAVSSKTKEIESALRSTTDEKDSLAAQLAEQKQELERASRKRAELEAEFEAERETLRKGAAAAAVAASPKASDDPASPAAASTAAGDSLAADLLYTQNLLLKRNAELAELEDRLAALSRSSHSSDAAWSRKFEALQREKVGVEEELALAREKRDKERSKLSEREEREREAKLASIQSASAIGASLAQVQSDLDTANAKIDELHESVASKQSKISEQQDKLNTLTRTAETLTRDNATLREEVLAVQTKLEGALEAHAVAAAKLEAERNAAQTELQQLTQAHEALTARRMVFDRISAENLAGAKAAAAASAASSKDAKSAALQVQATLDALSKKVDFYESQLQTADEDMLMAKQSWLATSLVLQSQVESLDRTVAALKVDLAAAKESKGMDAARLANLESKLKKTEKDKGKLSELMSRFEVELTQKKVELAASLDQLSTQEYENEKLKVRGPLPSRRAMHMWR